MSRQLCQAAYQSTFRTVSEALQSGDPLVVAATSLRHVEQTVDGFRQLTAATIDCRAGCSFCCWLRIDVRAHEVLLINRFLQRDDQAHHRPATAARVRAAAAQVAGRTHGERQALHRPCALLDHAGCCTVYPVRPAACRRYLSVSVDACEAIWNGDPPATEPEHPMIAEPGRYAANGAHNAFIAAGYDGYSYDLMAALAEALDDPACEARWRLKQPAFSEQARSSTPDGFSQDEALARLRTELRPEAPGLQP
jgi:Fe-S-cluster containining protein